MKAIVVALLWACTTSHASEKVAATTKELVVPKSVFVSETGSGKDPFFPYSTRRQQTLVRTVSTNNVSRSSTAWSGLALKGISGTTAQRLAIINSSTIAEGELADIRCGREVVKLRCLEIREASVLVELYGTSETKELKLREGI